MYSYLKKEKMIFLAIIGFAIIVTFIGLAAEAGYISLIFQSNTKSKNDNNLSTNYNENVDTLANDNIIDSNLTDQSDETINTDEGLKTPFPIIDAVVAGSGRYLVLRLQSLPGLIIYDAQSASFVHSINLPSDNFLYTAGGSIVLVYYPENNLLQTWSLESFETLKTESNPNGIGIRYMTMGYSNDNRAFIRYSTGTEGLDKTAAYLLDINSLQEITHADSPPPTLEFNTRNKNFIHQRANGNMSFVSEWRTSSFPTDLVMFHLSNNSWTSYFGWGSVDYIAMGDDGLLYISTRDLGNKKGEIYIAQDFYNKNGAIYTNILAKVSEFPGSHLIPGIGGSLFLGISDAGVMQVYASGSTSPIGPVGKFPGLDNREDYLAMVAESRLTTYGFDRHIVFDPTHGYILLIPPENDRIIQRDFDLVQMMEDASVDYLIVTSIPNTDATIGETWQYKIETLTNSSNVKYSIELGPKGMSIDSDGLLRWYVPTEDYGTSEKVVIFVENENHDSTYHNFELQITETP